MRCKYLGRLLGMAIAHESPLGVLLVPSFCKLLCAETVTFDDLVHVYPEQHRSLSQLRGKVDTRRTRAAQANPSYCRRYFSHRSGPQLGG